MGVAFVAMLGSLSLSPPSSQSLYMSLSLRALVLVLATAFVLDFGLALAFDVGGYCDEGGMVHSSMDSTRTATTTTTSTTTSWSHAKRACVVRSL